MRILFKRIPSESWHGYLIMSHQFMGDVTDQWLYNLTPPKKKPLGYLSVLLTTDERSSSKFTDWEGCVTDVHSFKMYCQILRLNSNQNASKKRYEEISYPAKASMEMFHWDLNFEHLNAHLFLSRKKAFKVAIWFERLLGFHTHQLMSWHKKAFHINSTLWWESTHQLSMDSNHTGPGWLAWCSICS